LQTGSVPDVAVNILAEFTAPSVPVAVFAAVQFVFTQAELVKSRD